MKGYAAVRMSITQVWHGTSYLHVICCSKQAYYLTTIATAAVAVDLANSSVMVVTLVWFLLVC